MEKKVYYSVMWFLDCRPNSSRCYSREYEDFDKAMEKFGIVSRKNNVYCARLTERIRTFVDGVHVHTLVKVIGSIDKY